MNRVPKSGELYRHFKNKLYQVVTVATHSETREELVIYQALYGDFKVYARPLEMFISEVDHEKYPEVEQKYRFEKVEQESLQKQGQNMSVEIQRETDNVQEQARKSRENQSVEEKLAEFFDTEELETRYNILVSLKGEVTDLMINNMAVVLDVVIPDGDVDTRYEELKRCIRTKQKYENSRLR